MIHRKVAEIAVISENKYKIKTVLPQQSGSHSKMNYVQRERPATYLFTRAMEGLRINFDRD